MVVSRAWNRVDVKVELITVEAAKGVELQGLVYRGVGRAGNMGVSGRGAMIPRVGVPGGGIAGTPAALVTIGRMGRNGSAGAAVLQGALVGGCFRCAEGGH